MDSYVPKASKYVTLLRIIYNKNEIHDSYEKNLFFF